VGAVLIPDGCFDTSAVTSIMHIFRNSGIADINVSLPTLSPRYTSLYGMFRGASNFDGIVSIDTSSVTTMAVMFDGARKFDKPLRFNPSKVTSFQVIGQRSSSTNHSTGTRL
jgi:hypothetical protein